MSLDWQLTSCLYRSFTQSIYKRTIEQKITKRNQDQNIPKFIDMYNTIMLKLILITCLKPNDPTDRY